MIGLFNSPRVQDTLVPEMDNENRNWGKARRNYSVVRHQADCPISVHIFPILDIKGFLDLVLCKY